MLSTDALALALWRPPQDGLGPEPYLEWPDILRTEIHETAESALLAASQQFPDHDVLLIQVNLPLPSGFLHRMMTGWKQYIEVEVLSPLDQEFGVAIPTMPESEIDVAQFLYGEHAIERVTRWTRHGSLWRAGALHDVFVSGHRTIRQLNFSVMRGVYVAGVVEPKNDQAFIGDGKSVVLHVLHSWGGGVEYFARDLRAADKARHHLFLKALSIDSLPPFGKQLALYHSTSEEPLQVWRLENPIDDTAIRSDEVRSILTSIIDRWGVGAVIVSSLIGHSLDVLKTGLPTVLACHDVYPFWPLLHDRRELGDADFSFDYLQSFLAQDSDVISFKQHTAEYWTAIKEHLTETILGRYIHCVAPSEYAKKRLCAIDGKLEQADWEIIPHGTAVMDRFDRSQKTDCDSKLRVLVPGHVNGEKGETLLLAMLPILPPDIELVLLGCAGYLEHKFRHEAVTCYPEYRREDLSIWVKKINPDIALLPSLVPETFGYVLSEMLTAGLPVICANIGAYAERAIAQGSVVTVAPNANAFIEKLEYFRDSREVLGKLADAAPTGIPSLADMADAWAKVCNAGPPNWFFQYPSSVQTQEKSAMDRKIDQLIEMSIKTNSLHQEQQRKNADTLDQLLASNKQWEDRFEKLQAESNLREQTLAISAEKLQKSLVAESQLKSALLEQQNNAQAQMDELRKLQSEQLEKSLCKENDLRSELLQQQKNHIELQKLQLQQNEAYLTRIMELHENKTGQLQAAFQNELTSRDAFAESLKQQLQDRARELQERTDTLDAVYQSSSWRLTALFRNVKTWFIK